MQVIVLQAVRHRRCGQLSAPVVVGGEQALEGGGFLTSQPAILGGTGSEFVEQPPVLQGQLRGDPGGIPVVKRRSLFLARASCASAYRGSSRS